MSEVTVSADDLSEVLTWLENPPNICQIVTIETVPGDRMTFEWDESMDCMKLIEVL